MSLQIRFHQNMISNAEGFDITCVRSIKMLNRVYLTDFHAIYLCHRMIQFTIT